MRDKDKKRSLFPSLKGKKKRLVVCFCCAMATALAVGTFATACKEDDTPSNSEIVEYGEAGVYYDEVNGQECLLTLVETNNSFVMLLGADEVVTGTYEYDGTNLVLTVLGQTANVQASLVDGLVTLKYSGVTYEFVRKVSYTVTYDVNGGSAIAPATVVNGKKLEKPADPVKEGYNFVGWYQDATYNTKFDFDAPIKADTTVYARFESTNAGQGEYVVTFVVDGDETVYAKQSTISGKVFDLPVPEAKDGAKFVGWWISDYQDADKLTAQYTGQALTENTNLYAVWESNALNVSVSENGVAWIEKGVNLNYFIKIKDSEGNVLNGNGNGETPGAASYTFDFTSRPEGDYTVEVELNGVTTTAYYQNRALDRVSAFSVAEPSVLIFNRVPNAQKYLITVECGDETHAHTAVDLGDKNFYDFSNCTMQKGGIKFTVEAVAEGYVTSVSEAYVYSRDLTAVTGLAVDTANEQVAWNKVANATSYVVEVTAGGNVYTENIGPTTVYSIKEYTGEISVKVYPVANGYNSPDPVAISYVKNTLSAPVSVALKGKTLSWNAVEGASKYMVKIGSKEFEVNGTSLALTEEHYDTARDQYQVSVKAISATAGKDSMYSNAITVRFNSMSALSYVNGVLSWESVISADRYSVRVNNNEAGITTLNGDKTSYEPVLTKGGVNTLSVCYYDDEGNQSSWVHLEIYAYKISFEEDGGEYCSAIYKANGDSLSFKGTTKEGYDFDGWYTAQGGALGTGVKYESNVFQSNGDLTLYAGWVAKKYEAILNVTGGEALDENMVSVTYKENFVLPVPVNSDVSKVFDGWYSEENGAGICYTDKDGKSLAGWSISSGATLYANWIQPLKFVEIENGQAYSVSAGVNIDRVTSITIPAEYNGKKVTTVEGSAFRGCSNLISIDIPDTIETIYKPLDGADGTGSPFQGCTALETINVYCTCGDPSHSNPEAKPAYESVDGILLHNNINTGKEVQFVPRARTGRVEIPYGVTTIPVGAFKESKITEVVIPVTVTNIHDSAFESSKITKVTFVETPVGVPEEALELGEKVFRYCTGLTSVTFPSRLSVFSPTVFQNCWYLTEVNVTGYVDGKYSSKDGALCEGSTLVYVPVGTRKNISGSEDQPIGQYIIPQGITTIGQGAFQSCRYITDVVIPYYVTTIETEAFKGLDMIKTVTFQGDADSDLINIESQAFYGCYGIQKLTLPVNAGYIAANAFGSTTSLIEVDVQGGAGMELEEGAFADLYDNFYVVRLNIGKDVGEFDIAGVFGGVKLAKVTVEAGNENYSATEDGVLFNKDQTSIVYYPTTKAGEYTIPDTVTTIGAQVFRSKTSLTKIKIGYNVKTIGKDAFKGCSNLTVIEFEPTPEGVEAVPLTIAEGAFQSTSLASISLPERLTTIGNEVFASCLNLQSIYIPATVTSIGKVDADGNVTAMDVFDYCNALREINVDENNAYYGSIDGVFYGKDASGAFDELFICPRLNTGDENHVVTIPGTVKKIWASAFESNNGVREVAFDDLIADAEGNVSISFGASLFANTKTLQKVVLPNGLQTLPSRIFGSCSALTTVVIPNTVTKVEERAITYCPLLTTIEFEAGGTAGLSFASASDAWSGVIYDCKSLETLTLPERTESIGTRAFGFNTALKTVTIPSTVTSVGGYVFAGCTSLTTVNFTEGSSLKALSAYMFDGCTSLTTINLPEGLVSIGEYAFYKNTALETIVIPASVTEIGASAFEEARALTTVVLAKDGALDVIGDRAFFNAISLNASAITAEGAEAQFVIPSSVTEIGDSAFERCVSLNNLTFAENSNLASLGASAFAYTSLNKFVFPNTVSGLAVTIGEKLFAGCKELTDVHLSATVASIDNITKGCFSIVRMTVDPNNTNFNLFVDEKLPDVTFLMNADGTGYRYIFGELVGEYTLTGAEGTNISDIGASAFANQEFITKIVIPKSVQTIADNAFKGCLNLEEVVFEEGGALTSIGQYAFADCRKLKAITGLPDGLANIGNYAFQNTFALTEVKLPDSITKLGTYVFQNSGIQKVNVPTGITQLPNYTFQNCKSLTSVALHGAMTKLGNYSFDGTSSLQSIDLSTMAASGVTLGSYVFRYSGLTSIKIPASITAIPTYAFQYCDKLTSVTFHDELVSIGNYAFHYCTSLEAVDLPNVPTLGTYLFADCTSLSSVTLDDQITALKGSMFLNCTSLKKIELPDGMTGLSTAFTGSGLESVIIPAGITSLDATFRNCVNLTQVIFVEGSALTKLTGTFNGCTSLAKITLPQTVTTIGASTFQGTALKEIDLSNVTAFGTSSSGAGNVFQDTPNLEKVIFNKDVTVLGTYFFRNSAIKNVELPEGLVKLSGYMFIGSGVEELVIPEKVSTIDYYTFGGLSYGAATKLRAVEFKGTMSSLPSYLFDGCVSLENVILPSGITKLPSYIFRNCKSLKEITLPDTVTSFDTYVFYGCEKLESITLPENMTSIPQYTFYGCASLNSIKWPKAVTSIGNFAFYGTTGLQAVQIPDTVTSIGQYAFTLSGLSTVAISKNVTSIGTGAFGGRNLTEITVNSQNTVYRSDENGILYSGNSIIAYPMASLVDENGTLTLSASLPDGITLGAGSLMMDNVKKVVLPATMKSIPSSMFRNLTTLEEVVVPDGVTSIGSYAFEGCTNLKTISLPDSVTSIGTYAFQNCTSLMRVNLSEKSNLQYISNWAFNGCSALEYIYVPQTLLEVGTAAFKNTAALAIDMNLPDTLESFGNDVFAGSGITGLVLPSCVTVLGDEEEREGTVLYYSWDFQNCTNLERVTMLGMEIIGTGAFSGCTNLKELNYTDSLYAIGNNAFENCGFEELVIKPTITQWGYYVFQGCKQLKKVTFEDGCTTTALYIGNPDEVRDTDGYMFYNCTALETVILPDTMEYIESYTFAGCTSLTDIVIPEYAYVGSNAFSGMTQDQTINVVVKAAQANDLWSSSWNKNCLANVVYRYKAPAGSDGETTDGE